MDSGDQARINDRIDQLVVHLSTVAQRLEHVAGTLQVVEAVGAKVDRLADVFAAYRETSATVRAKTSASQEEFGRRLQAVEAQIKEMDSHLNRARLNRVQAMAALGGSAAAGGAVAELLRQLIDTYSG
jgi:hypothetical protein